MTRTVTRRILTVGAMAGSLSSRMHVRAAAVCGLAALVLAGLFGASESAARFFRPGAIRVLIFSGRNNHDWRTTTPFLRSLLTDSGRFDVRVCEEPAGTTAETLEPYDVLVMDYAGPRWGEATEKAVESFVKSGKGMVVVHGASYGFGVLELLADGHVRTGIKESPWKEYARMVGGVWPEEPPEKFHGQRHSFPVKIVQANHAILNGMKEIFIATDELYHGMKFLPQAQILATAYDHPKTGGTGKEEPMLVANQYGQGRVFYTALGHEVAAMREPGFITTFIRGVEWAGTGKVTLPADIGEAKSQADLLRVLVVTGGHDYESSFYTVFEGYRDLVWTHATSSQAAFKSDIRNKYDVLVLYDYTQDLDLKGRRNLQDFVESGKGVVVLHHAICDYQDWEWWYKEVVGGKYLLKAEGNLPASTYKHNEELFVQPVVRHPITDPIGPIHIRDETYKGKWISSGNTVLLTTDNPTCDPPVAWISAYPKSRVIYIALGHDGAAYHHPAFRALVRNSMLWSSGRLR